MQCGKRPRWQMTYRLDIVFHITPLLPQFYCFFKKTKVSVLYFNAVLNIIPILYALLYLCVSIFKQSFIHLTWCGSSRAWCRCASLWIKRKDSIKWSDGIANFYTFCESIIKSLPKRKWDIKLFNNCQCV